MSKPLTSTESCKHRTPLSSVTFLLQRTLHPLDAIHPFEVRHQIRRQKVTRPLLSDLCLQVITCNAHVVVIEPRDDLLHIPRYLLDERVNVQCCNWVARVLHMSKCISKIR